jgi:hypothetical protein
MRTSFTTVPVHTIFVCGSLIAAIACSSSSPPDAHALAPDAGESPAQAEAGAPDCTLDTYFFDNDGDGYAGTQSQESCGSPGKDWVKKTGDCNDNNPLVYPDSKKFYEKGYIFRGHVSFDYNCDAVEEESPGVSPVKFQGCTGSASNCGAIGSGGYVKSITSRKDGPGLDNWCGSNLVAQCQEVSNDVGGIRVLTCNEVDVLAPTTILCR